MNSELEKGQPGIFVAWKFLKRVSPHIWQERNLEKVNVMLSLHTPWSTTSYFGWHEAIYHKSILVRGTWGSVCDLAILDRRAKCFPALMQDFHDNILQKISFA